MGEAGDQPQDHREYRIQRDATTFTVMAGSGASDGAMKLSFRFSTKPRHLSDFNEMCTFHQTADPFHFTRKGRRHHLDC